MEAAIAKVVLSQTMTGCLRQAPGAGQLAVSGALQGHPDQAAGQALACKLVSIGYAHLTVAPMNSIMSIEELEPLFS